MSAYWEITYSELGQRSKMERFGKIITVFTFFCKKLHFKSLRGFCMCRVLNMSDFWIFVNFRKYDRVLNICRDIIMDGFRISQDSEYVGFLHMQALHKILNMPEYGWMMPYGRVLSMSGQRLTGLSISLRF